MSSEFLVQKVGNILQGSDGKTLEEMIHELGASKVSALKWLQSLEKDGLVYRTRLMKAGRKGRPQSVYHPTKNLKTFIGKESSNSMVMLDFSKLKTICRYEKGGMCKALLPKLQRCESQLCPYLK
jgi:predicted transcriptional regulator